MTNVFLAFFLAKFCITLSKFTVFAMSVSIVLRTLAGLPRVRFEMLGIAAKYDIDDLRYSTETVKNAVWLSFVNNIRF